MEIHGLAGEQASAVVQGCAGVCGDGVDAGAGQGDGGARASGKIREGVGFFNRGVRLLGSDVSSAGPPLLPRRRRRIAEAS